MKLDSALASRLASIALSHVRREYPNKLDHVLTGPEDAQTPRALHPVFHGSFDWHSCVHSYWLLATVFRLHKDIPESGAICELFNQALAAENIAAECAYLTRPATGSFERPYGWAWLLALQAELLRHDLRPGAMGESPLGPLPEPADAASTLPQGEGGSGWASLLRPLADLFVQRFCEWLPRATYPVRSGTHGNTAFALRLAFDYAETARDSPFAELLRSSAIRWYGNDADCQCWEPCGEDFLSPSLVEAQCMGAVVGQAEFRGWFARFLPRLQQSEPATLFNPAYVSDRSDGRIVHLDGLNSAEHGHGGKSLRCSRRKIRPGRSLSVPRNGILPLHCPGSPAIIWASTGWPLTRFSSCSTERACPGRPAGFLQRRCRLSMNCRHVDTHANTCGLRRHISPGGWSCGCR